MVGWVVGWFYGTPVHFLFTSVFTNVSTYSVCVFRPKQTELVFIKSEDFNRWSSISWVNGHFGKKRRKFEKWYLECFYGPRNVCNRFRHFEILFYVPKNTSKVHLSSELAALEVEVTDFDEFRLKSLLFQQQWIHWFSLEFHEFSPLTFNGTYLGAQEELEGVLGLVSE